MSRWEAAVGVDPAEGMAGWCVLLRRVGESEWGHQASGQCKGKDVPAQLLAVLPSDCVVVVFNIENMFQGRAKSTRAVKPPPHFWKLGFRTGYISGTLMADDRFTNAIFETPQPAQWRARLGLNGGDRNAIAKRVHLWAQASTGEELVGPRGGKQIDRAMAVGIATASTTTLARRYA